MFVFMIMHETSLQSSQYTSPWRKGTMSSAMGTQKWLDITQYSNTKQCVDTLISTGYRVFVTNVDNRAVSLADIDFRRQTSSTRPSCITSSTPPTTTTTIASTALHTNEMSTKDNNMTITESGSGLQNCVSDIISPVKNNHLYPSINNTDTSNTTTNAFNYYHHQQQQQHQHHHHQQQHPSLEKIAIIMGNELSGISDYLKSCDNVESFYIPMKGFADSLNLSVASSVVCAHLNSLGLLEAIGNANEKDRSDQRRVYLMLLMRAVDIHSFNVCDTAVVK